MLACGMLLPPPYFTLFNLPVAHASSIASATLWVDGFDNSRTGWDRYGSSPYLDAQDYSESTTYKGLEGFDYRKNITISGGSSSVTDYQIKLVLHYGSGTDSGNHIYLNSHVQSDFDDIRFTTNTSLSLLDYYIEEKYDGDNCTVWVKVPSIPTGGATICIYYGNSSVSSLSNGTATFIFFDDMETWEGWTQYGDGEVSQDSSRAFEGTYSAHKTTANDPHGAYKDIGQTLGRDIALEFRVNRNSGYSGGAYDRVGIIDNDGNGYGWAYDHGGNYLKIDKRTNYEGSILASQSATDEMDAWSKAVLILLSDGTIKAKRYLSDGTSSGDLSYTETTYSSFTRVYIFGGHDYVVDQMFIRKCIATEPSVSSTTAEENNKITETSGSYVYSDEVPEEIGDWTFEDLPSDATSVVNATLYIYMTSKVSTYNMIRVYLWNGTDWISLSKRPSGTPWHWVDIDVSDVLDTVEKVNNVKMYFVSEGFSGYWVKADAAKLVVHYQISGISVNSFSNSESQNWVLVGDNPYLHWNTSSYVYTGTGAQNLSWFNFYDISSENDLKDYRYLEIEWKAKDEDVYCQIILNNGTDDLQLTVYPPVGASYSWTYIDVSDFLDTMDEVNNAKVKFVAPSLSLADLYIRQMYISFYSEGEQPEAYHGSASEIDRDLVTTFEVGTNAIFKSKWETSFELDSLSHYIFSYKIGDEAWQNTTAQPFPEDSQWATYTLQLPSNETDIQARFYVNITGGEWFAGEIFDLFTVKQKPTYIEQDMGLSTIGGRGGVVYQGAINALYYAYLNSTCGMYQIRAFNLETKTWTPAFNISAPESVDAHWTPSVGVMPNGSIIVVYGYYTPLKYRLTTQSADTQSNLTELFSSWTEEREIPNTSSPYSCYPFTLSFSDKVIIFYRRGGSINGNWSYTVFNGTAWEDKGTFIYNSLPEDTHSLYLGVRIQDGKILVTAHMETVNGKKHAYFVYSPDNGTTWYNVSGHTQTLPIDIYTNKHVLAFNTSGTKYYGEIQAAIVNGHVYIPLKVWGDQGYSIKIVWYNGTIGYSNGTWNLVTPKDSLGNKYTKLMSIDIDEHYNRLTAFACLKTVDTNKYHVVYDTYRILFDINNPERTIKLEKIANETEIYFVWRTTVQYAEWTYKWPCFARKGGILGTYEYSQNSYCDYNITIGTKFTAEQNETINGIAVVAKKGPTQENFKAAIYDENLTLLEECWEVENLPASFTRWTIASLKNPVQIVAGKTYWILIRTNNYAYISYSNGEVNQTFISYAINYSDPWPTQITSDMIDHYENTKLAAFAVKSTIIMLGISGKPSLIEGTVGVNNTVCLKPTLFHAKWYDINGLDHAEFYWNASGTMQLNGTISLSGSTAWSNFTRILPQVDVIAWYIKCYNIYGEWTNTSVQILDVAICLEVTFSENVNVSGFGSKRMEKSFRLTCLAECSDSKFSHVSLMISASSDLALTDSAYSMRGLVYGLAENVAFADGFSEWKERLICMSEALEASGTYDLSKSLVVVLSGDLASASDLERQMSILLVTSTTVNPESLNSMSHESMIELIGSAKASAAEASGKERLVVLAVTPNVQAENQVSFEMLVISLEVVNSETAEVKAELYQMKEKTFECSSLAKAIAEMTQSKETTIVAFEFTKLENVKMDDLMQILKEMGFTNIEECKIKTVQISMKEKTIIVMEIEKPKAEASHTKSMFIALSQNPAVKALMQASRAIHIIIMEFQEIISPNTEMFMVKSARPTEINLGIVALC
ncbi:hypothetical protein DRO33_01370, partial [Candidatus Bathyarchaeota archaeon]